MQKYKLISATSNATGRPSVGTSGRLVGQEVLAHPVTSMEVGESLTIISAADTEKIDGIFTSNIIDIDWDGSWRKVTVTTLNTTYVMEETA
ncbi:hypothetical protein P7G87_00455 [Enterococcus asini]|uniref:hypothetical protein n=1 Tax=Enterococcus asini TaxID=57732 RepID=UPI00288F699E|nr:hypothetical protein [Enterococcus asini]MDT2783158.1 hypothetical protein [Enterococcus asini]